VDAFNLQSARHEIAEYIELFYNRQRRHSRLGNLSPGAFAQQWARQQPGGMRLHPMASTIDDLGQKS